jgi:hypothetical protein
LVQKTSTITQDERKKTMDTKSNRHYPAAYLETGAAIMTAAQVVDTTLIQSRLSVFGGAHRDYTEAHLNVVAVEAEISAMQPRLAECDAALDEAVEALANKLVNDGQSRRNPFASFGAKCPSGIKQLDVADKAAAIHKLVVAVRGGKTVGKAILAAAQTADRAAQAMEAALGPLNTTQVKLREAREAREAIAQNWKTTLAALKRGARAAADDGAPRLYAALFGELSRPPRKKATRAAAAPEPAQAQA